MGRIDEDRASPNPWLQKPRISGPDHQMRLSDADRYNYETLFGASRKDRSACVDSQKVPLDDCEHVRCAVRLPALVNR